MNNNYMGMNIELLKNKWQSIEDTYNNDNPWVFIVLDEVCVPHLNIAINDKKNRCILLKTNSSSSQNIKTVIKENIKFSYSKVYKQFVLELLDDSFLDLFDDLIISIYNKIHQETNDREAASIFTDTIVKWMNFFIKGGNDNLSESIIRGLFGELIVLKDYLTTLDKLHVNEVLKAWQGPYNSPTDFVFDNSLVEVKTKRSDASIVKISSEFQLEEVSGKSLILKVVSIETIEGSIATISSIFTEIKEVIRAKGGDLGIFMSAMNGLGINISTIKLYDHYCYTPNQIEDYDCLLEHEGLGFPKLVNASLPNQITKVKYDLNLHTLERYRIKLKEI